MALAADVQLSGVADGISGGATRPAAGCAAVAARLQPSGGAYGSSWGGAQPAVAPAAAVSPQQQPELRDVWTGHLAEGARTAVAGGRCPKAAAQLPQLNPEQRPVWTHRGWRMSVPRCKRSRHNRLHKNQQVGITAAEGPAGVALAAPPVVSQAPCRPACTRTSSSDQHCSNSGAQPERSLHPRLASARHPLALPSNAAANGRS